MTYMSSILLLKMLNMFYIGLTGHMENAFSFEVFKILLFII